MEQIYEERKQKVERIIEEYGKRKSQKIVAEVFNMSIGDVSKVTKENNYSHTVNLNEANPDGKPIKPLIYYHDFDFLDKYPIESFM